MLHIIRFLKTLKQWLEKVNKPIEQITLGNINQLNSDIIDLIYYIDSEENLEDIVFSPVNKLLILNVYYSTFEELLDNLTGESNVRSISSVNVNAYFNNKSALTNNLKRIVTIIRDNKLSSFVSHDLYEIAQNIEMLVKTNNAGVDNA